MRGAEACVEQGENKEDNNIHKEPIAISRISEPNIRRLFQNQQDKKNKLRQSREPFVNECV